MQPNLVQLAMALAFNIVISRDNGKRVNSMPATADSIDKMIPVYRSPARPVFKPLVAKEMGLDLRHVIQMVLGSALAN